MLAHPFLILALTILVLPLALTTAVLGALVPYFLLGAIGQLWWKWQQRPGQLPRGESYPYPIDEKALWIAESKSLAETISPATESWREAG